MLNISAKDLLTLVDVGALRATVRECESSKSTTFRPDISVDYLLAASYALAPASGHFNAAASDPGIIGGLAVRLFPPRAERGSSEFAAVSVSSGGYFLAAEDTRSKTDRQCSPLSVPN